MNYGLIAIFDNDSEYANCLADYFRLKGCLSSEIIVFTKEDRFIDYTKEHAFDILLINEQFITDDGTILGYKIPKHNVFTLCENRVIAEDDTSICLFKYTSAEELLREVMAGYKPMIPGVAIPFRDKHKSKIIGIYSPVNRCGKTSFALALAMNYSRTSSCLFISFDDYSSMELLADSDSPTKTIDDLLYYYTSSPDVFDNKLLSVIKKIQHLDFVFPSKQSCYIGEMNVSEQIQFLQDLLNAGQYDYVFLDIGAISPVYPILQLCEKVYLPYIADDTYSETKLSNFMDSIKYINADNQVSFQQIAPPVINYSNHGSDYLYSLTSGEMSHFIASL